MCSFLSRYRHNYRFMMAGVNIYWDKAIGKSELCFPHFVVTLASFFLSLRMYIQELDLQPFLDEDRWAPVPMKSSLDSLIASWTTPRTLVILVLSTQWINPADPNYHSRYFMAPHHKTTFVCKQFRGGNFFSSSNPLPRQHSRISWQQLSRQPISWQQSARIQFKQRQRIPLWQLHGRPTTWWRWRLWW